MFPVDDNLAGLFNKMYGFMDGRCDFVMPVTRTADNGYNMCPGLLIHQIYLPSAGARQGSPSCFEGVIAGLLPFILPRMDTW